MVSLKQVVSGALAYAQENIVANMIPKSPNRFAMDVAIGFLALNMDNTCKLVKNTQYYIMAKSLGVISDDDMIDLEKAAPLFATAMKRSGLEITTKNGARSFNFDENDIDKLIATIKMANG